MDNPQKAAIIMCIFTGIYKVYSSLISIISTFNNATHWDLHCDAATYKKADFIHINVSYLSVRLGANDIQPNMKAFVMLRYYD